MVGFQDLALNESAATAALRSLMPLRSPVIWRWELILGSGATTVTDLSLGSSNLVVTPQDSVAIEDLSAGNAQIELGIDLNTVIFGYNSQPATGEFNQTQYRSWKYAGAAPAPVTISSY